MNLASGWGGGKVSSDAAALWLPTMKDSHNATSCVGSSLPPGVMASMQPSTEMPAQADAVRAERSSLAVGEVFWKQLAPAVWRDVLHRGVQQREILEAGSVHYTGERAPAHPQLEPALCTGVSTG